MYTELQIGWNGVVKERRKKENDRLKQESQLEKEISFDANLEKNSKYRQSQIISSTKECFRKLENMEMENSHPKELKSSFDVDVVVCDQK